MTAPSYLEKIDVELLQLLRALRCNSIENDNQIKALLRRELVPFIAYAPAPTNLGLVFLKLRERTRPTEFAARLQQRLGTINVGILQVAGDTGIDFIVRGILPRRWVEPMSKDIGDLLEASQLNLKPIRYRWQAANGFPGPNFWTRPIRSPGQTDFKELLARPDPYCRRFIYDPRKVPVCRYLVFIEASNEEDFAREMNSDRLTTEALKDLFTITMDPIYGTGTKHYSKLFDHVTHVGVCEFSFAGFRDHQDDSAVVYRDPTSEAQHWRNHVLTSHSNYVRRIEMIPFTVLQQTHEVFDLVSDYQLDQLKYDSVAPFAHIREPDLGPQQQAHLPVEPNLAIPIGTLMIFGCRRHGKSVIGFIILAQLLKQGYDVVFVNYKLMQSKSGRGPHETKELHDFSRVVNTLTGDYATPIRVGDFVNKVKESSRPGAYYIEPTRGLRTTTIIEEFEKVCGATVKKRTCKLFVLFDEIVNNGDAKSAEVLLAAHQSWPSSDSYLGILHQELGNLSPGWAEFLLQSSVVITKLDPTDGNVAVFEQLVAQAKKEEEPKVELDVTFDQVRSLNQKRKGEIYLFARTTKASSLPYPGIVPRIDGLWSEKTYPPSVKWGSPYRVARQG